MILALVKTQLDLFCVLCWKIWSSRNAALWNARPTNPQFIIEHGLRFLDEYCRIEALKGGRAAETLSGTDTWWNPPDDGYIKINVDDALSLQHRIFGMRVVARDSSGEVLAAMACQGQGVMDAEVVEACSLRKALQGARELSIGRIILETDCACLATALNGNAPAMNTGLGVILADCRILMTSFLSCRIQHVRRNGNSVAHELAKQALHAEADEFWIEEVPVNLAHLVTGDKSAFCTH